MRVSGVTLSAPSSSEEILGAGSGRELRCSGIRRARWPLLAGSIPSRPRGRHLPRRARRHPPRRRHLRHARRMAGQRPPLPIPNAPWPSSNRPAIMRQSPQSRPATRHRESLESPPRHGAQSHRSSANLPSASPLRCVSRAAIRDRGLKAAGGVRTDPCTAGNVLCQSPRLAYVARLQSALPSRNRLRVDMRFTNEAARLDLWSRPRRVH